MSSTQPIDVLLIEDNPRDAELTLRALKKQNLNNRIERLKDGNEAIEYFFGDGCEERLRRSPKVVLLDLKLPKVDGVEVLRRMKASAATKNIPVVILTSSKEDRDVERCYELSANSYIVKPVKFPNFAEAVASLGFYWVAMNAPHPDLAEE